MTNGLRRGTQFDVPMRKELVTVSESVWRCGSGEVVRDVTWQQF